MDVVVINANEQRAVDVDCLICQTMTSAAWTQTLAARMQRVPTHLAVTPAPATLDITEMVSPAPVWSLVDMFSLCDPPRRNIISACLFRLSIFVCRIVAKSFESRNVRQTSRIRENEIEARTAHPSTNFSGIRKALTQFSARCVAIVFVDTCFEPQQPQKS